MSPRRWLEMSICRIVVLLPTQSQCYAARQLRTVPHYQIDHDQLPELRARVEAHNSGVGDPIQLEVLSDTPNDFIVGLERLPPWLDMLDLLGPLAEAGLFSLKKGRNQMSLDLGTTGHNNSVRTRSTLGLPRPNCFAGTDTEETRRLFLALDSCLAELFPEHHRKLAAHTDRNKFFAHTHCPGSVLESVTLSLTEVSTHNNLGAHTDFHNDHGSEEHERVVVMSQMLWEKSSGKLVRIAAVLYWKQAANDFLSRASLLIPPASEIMLYAEQVMGEEVRRVGPHLIPGEGQDAVCLGETHSCKFVTFTVAAEAIRHACSVCPDLQTEKHVSAMIYCSIATNMPRVFGEVLIRSARSPQSVFSAAPGSLPLSSFAHELYQAVRAESAAGREARPYVASPRHRPCHTTASREAVNASVLAVHRMIVNLVEVSSRDARDCRSNPSYYYERAVANLSRAWGLECGGAHGAGTFGSQFLIGVAGLLFPINGAICCCASVGHQTLTGCWLREAFGLSTTPKEFQSESGRLVGMVSSCLGLPATVAEEVICKAGKHSRGTGGQFEDQVPWFVRRVNYRLAGGKLMAVLGDGSRVEQSPLIPTVSLEGAFGGYWDVRSHETKLPQRRTRSRSGMLRTIGQQFPLEGKEGLVRVLSPEWVILSDTRGRTSPFDAASIASASGGALFRRVIVGPGNVVLDQSARAHHKKGWSDSQEASDDPQGTRNDPEERPAGRKGGRRKRKRSMPRWHAAGIIVNGAPVFPPEDFALGRDGPGSSLVHQGYRFFQEKDDALEFAVLFACLTDPDCFCHLKAARHLLLPMPCDCHSDEAWQGGEDPVVNHAVISRRTSFKRMTGGEMRSRLPHLVALRCGSGARAVYLVDPASGLPISHVHLSYAMEPLRRSFSETMECVGIITHRKSGGSVEVMIAWEDSTRSWLPLREVAEGAPWAVAFYAWKNGLSRKDQWRSTKKARHAWCLDPGSSRGHSDGDVLKRSARLMGKLKRRKRLLGKGMEPEVVDQVINQRIRTVARPRWAPAKQNNNK